jgi:gas vesicle protein
MQDNGKTSDGREYLLFALGVGAGLATGMLFAPKTGAEVRRAIGEKTQEGAEYLNRQSTALAVTPAQMVFNLKDFWLKHRDEVQAAVKLGKRFYEEVVQRPGNMGVAHGD